MFLIDEMDVTYCCCQLLLVLLLLLLNVIWASPSADLES
jgi:hypothetical protein